MAVVTGKALGKEAALAAAVVAALAVAAAAVEVECALVAEQEASSVSRCWLWM